MASWLMLSLDLKSDLSPTSPPFDASSATLCHSHDGRTTRPPLRICHCILCAIRLNPSKETLALRAGTVVRDRTTTPQTPHQHVSEPSGALNLWPCSGRRPIEPHQIVHTARAPNWPLHACATIEAEALFLVSSFHAPSIPRIGRRWGRCPRFWAPSGHVPELTLPLEDRLRLQIGCLGHRFTLKHSGIIR
ncbi:hypothetical protein P154DRAFT_578650 [Amniculicola lignicola CBS 123094]|uniref:Uncharacterized protein n=1 Tax=Amniculicola lignicola CBS 123094 TaxID=1392246 RepID=A0A6A5W705_9PLEO|nr:hypothetical protein P154DRAFT_578650 [Amniculicola lignicola CBS 123094]